MYQYPENLKPVSFFTGKWYAREDLFPEMFKEGQDPMHYNIMLQIGNCLDSREEAVKACNALREKLNAPPVS